MKGQHGRLDKSENWKPFLLGTPLIWSEDAMSVPELIGTTLDKLKYKNIIKYNTHFGLFNTFLLTILLHICSVVISYVFCINVQC